jgi:hypothetical protein
MELLASNIVFLAIPLESQEVQAVVFGRNDPKEIEL